MPALASDLRRQLGNVIIQARDMAEAAACATLKRLAVDSARPFDHFSEVQRQWRNRLRARARQADDQRQPNGEQEIEQLTQELAYEYWHRMLFARFLAENNLLMHPDGVAVSLADCEELAQIEGAENGWIMAARYASRMLPQIFRTDDVLLEIEFPINDRLPLEKLLASLPTETFTADDSLGWVYQFWQSKKKEEVNRSGAKIDGHTLPAVTQLFTEPYMVKFLLHNTIGAWWCAQHGIHGPPHEAGVPAGQAPVEMKYLRWRDDGTPAAGSFEGWPKTLKEFTMLDPCCGSGHFLVEAFRLLVPLRMHDEGLSPREACDVVLSENLFGLELDPRCTQIAAFALALAAWKCSDKSGQVLGYRPLPPLNIACSGQSVTGRKEEWLALANGDSRLLEGMNRLYDLFQQAPHLGSLINPRREVGDLIAAGFAELQPLLEKALVKGKVHQDADAAAVGIAAQGITKAAELLSKLYTLVATNVPFLGRNKQGSAVQAYCETTFPHAKADLATVFLQRCIAFCDEQGSVAIVTPQNWISLGSYRKLRVQVLKNSVFNFVAQLGPAAFQDMNWWAANTMLLVLTAMKPATEAQLAGVDVSGPRDPAEKAQLLRWKGTSEVSQSEQLQNPDSRIIIERLESHALISEVADFGKGSVTGDGPHYIRKFWEYQTFPSGFQFWLNSPDRTQLWAGRDNIVLWEVEDHDPTQEKGFALRGERVWGKRGVAIAKMNHFHCTLYAGELFDDNLAVLSPHDPSDLPALWAFCTSPEFKPTLRLLEPKMAVTAGTFVKLPFDAEQWRAAGSDLCPNGIPEPESNDPTQWLFRGEITGSSDPLQVAPARMLGYRWPEQPKEEDALYALADTDGIVCIPSVRREQPAAERLLDILRAAYGSLWSGAILNKLLTGAGCRPDMSLDEWLRDKFFEQHCRCFHHRPFIWHIWDGRKDGFACLVNYHKLNHQRLETLAYAYLQEWITAQAAAAREGKLGADLRLAAAQELQNKLKLILEGEPPYDIFVRWKPIHEQPIGWNPDLNDGVRVNIRPFVVADVLRKPPNIKWTKDRGKEQQRDPEQFPWFWKNGAFTGDRINDVHLTNAQKRAARERVNRGTGGLAYPPEVMIS